MERAMITGITGQDRHLTDFFLDEGYEVHGVIRRASTFNTELIDHLYREPHEDSRLFLHCGDLTDGSQLAHLIQTVNPEEIYNPSAIMVRPA